MNKSSAGVLNTAGDELPQAQEMQAPSIGVNLQWPSFVKEACRMGAWMNEMGLCLVSSLFNLSHTWLLERLL